MAAVRFAGLEKRYGAQPVLAPLDLTIEAGEFFTFVGPSGCGKSTLLALVAGIEAPSAGTIHFDARRVDALPPGERDVAMVFQSYALYPHLTVAENIAFPLRVRGMGRAEAAREAARVAEPLGLSGLLERRPAALSGGQRQRVALGRALVRRPAVFLMDEPLSNLDARLRLEMREELKRLHQRLGITVVYVTHDQEEAMALSGRMAVLNGGRIEQCGAPQAVYADPSTLFVAQFVGSPPINLLGRDAAGTFPGAAPLLEAHRGRDLLIGVRPADLQVHGSAKPGAIEATVSILEPTGSDLWVTLEWGAQRIKARAAPGAELVPGRVAYLEAPASQLMAFDRTNGERLRVPPSSH